MTSYTQNRKWDDLYYAPDQKCCRKGTITIKGTARFYDGITLPAHMQKRIKESGQLIGTKTDPQLTGGTAAVDHSISVTFSCCKDGGEQCLAPDSTKMWRHKSIKK